MATEDDEVEDVEDIFVTDRRAVSVSSGLMDGTRRRTAATTTTMTKSEE